MITVKGKVSIITGSTKGIGYAIARLFGAEGAKVVVTGRSEEECKAVADEIIAEGGEAVGIRCDVSDFSDLDRMIDEVIAKYGEINVLVNNVARVHWGPYLEAKPEDVEDSFKVIIGSSFFASQRVAKEMIRQGKGGRIIHIASTAGLYGERGNSIYCSAKAGLMNLAKTMALELGEYNITVNVVAPGTTVRKIEPRSEQVLEGFRIMSCLPQLNVPEDIAPAVAFLASDLAKGITGQTLACDGGFSIAMQPEKLFENR